MPSANNVPDDPVVGSFSIRGLRNPRITVPFNVCACRLKRSAFTGDYSITVRPIRCLTFGQTTYRLFSGTSRAPYSWEITKHWSVRSIASLFCQLGRFVYSPFRRGFPFSQFSPLSYPLYPFHPLLSLSLFSFFAPFTLLFYTRHFIVDFIQDPRSEGMKTKRSSPTYYANRGRERPRNATSCNTSPFPVLSLSKWREIFQVALQLQSTGAASTGGCLKNDAAPLMFLAFTRFYFLSAPAIRGRGGYRRMERFINKPGVFTETTVRKLRHSIN